MGGWPEMEKINCGYTVTKYSWARVCDDAPLNHCSPLGEQRMLQAGPQAWVHHSHLGAFFVLLDFRLYVAPEGFEPPSHELEQHNSN